MFAFTITITIGFSTRGGNILVTKTKLSALDSRLELGFDKASLLNTDYLKLIIVNLSDIKRHELIIYLFIYLYYIIIILHIS